MSFTKKETIILVLTVLLTILAIFALYYFYLEPKYNNIDTQTQTLKAEKELLASLESQQQKKSNITAESLAVLQRKVPVKPQQEQLILDLEQAEVISGTRIINMSFSEGDVAPPPAEIPEETNQENEKSDDEAKTESDENADTEDTNDEAAEENADAEDTEDNTTKENTYKPTPLPGGIKRLMVTLSVESADYEQLKKFIESLEGLQRTIVIETISFAGTAEVTELPAADAKEEEKIAYSLTLSAFFMPGLTDLQDKLPELVAPPPANKTNPFNLFPDF